MCLTHKCIKVIMYVRSKLAFWIFKNAMILWRLDIYFQLYEICRKTTLNFVDLDRKETQNVCICLCAHTFFISAISSYPASLWFFLLRIETQLKAPNPFSSDWDKSRLVEWVARRPMSASSMTLQDGKNKYRFIELGGTLFEFSAPAVLFHFCLPQCFALLFSLFFSNTNVNV